MSQSPPVSAVLKRRVVKSSEERRREILDAALKLFSEGGFLETTVEDIANEAGVAKGTIYLYFDSKDHVLVALKRRFMEGLVSEVSELIAAEVQALESKEAAGYTEMVDRIIDSVVDYHVRNREALELAVRQSAGPDLAGQTLQLERDFLSLLAQTFATGTSHGAIDVRDAEMTARIVHAAVRDTLCNCLCYGEPSDLDRLVGSLKEMLYKTLAPMPEG